MVEVDQFFIGFFMMSSEKERKDMLYPFKTNGTFYKATCNRLKSGWSIVYNEGLRL